MVDINALMSIDMVLYKQCPKKQFYKGILVLDITDGTYGVIDSVHGKIAYVQYKDGIHTISVNNLRRLVATDDRRRWN